VWRSDIVLYSSECLLYCILHLTVTCSGPMPNQSFWDDAEFGSGPEQCVGTSVRSWPLVHHSSSFICISHIAYRTSHIAHQRDDLPTSARCPHVASACVGTPILVARLTCVAGQPTASLPPGPTRFCQLAVRKLKSDLPALFLCRELLSPGPSYGWRPRGNPGKEKGERRKSKRLRVGGPRARGRGGTI
jgi:hypothetical protein